MAKVYVLRADEEESQHPVKVYGSVEIAMEKNPGEWTEWNGIRATLIKRSFRERYELEEFEVE